MPVYKVKTEDFCRDNNNKKAGFFTESGFLTLNFR